MRNLGVGFVLVLALLLTVGVASANPVDLVLWVGPWAPALDALQEVADRFAEQHPDVASVSVQVVVQKELVERLTLAVIGDTPPDVVTLPAPFVQYVINGLLQPIDPYLEQSERLHPTDYPPAIFESFAAFGQQYGIPNIEVGPGLVLIYSKDLFSQAGQHLRHPRIRDDHEQRNPRLA